MNDDFICCAICGFKAKNLRYHLDREHNISTKDYKNKYNSSIEAPSVKDKRIKTSTDKYGVGHYTNREAANFSYQVFEGGHPFKDPKVRKKAEDTKTKLYGDPHYTNKEKSKKTNLERYGVEHTCAAKDVIEKRKKTLLLRYGKIFNVDTPHNKLDVPAGFKDVYLSGKSLETISDYYGVSDPTVKRWAKELDLNRKHTVVTDRIISSPREIVIDYFKECASSKGA